MWNSSIAFQRRPQFMKFKTWDCKAVKIWGIYACRAVWVPGEDLATPHLMHNCRKYILSLHCTLYIRPCMHIYYMLVTMCLHVRSSWYEYACPGNARVCPGLQAPMIWGVDSVSFRRVGSIYCTWALPLMLGGYCMTNKSLASMHAYTQTCLQVSLLTQINGQIQTENGSVTKYMWVSSYLHCKN